MPSAGSDPSPALPVGPLPVLALRLIRLYGIYLLACALLFGLACLPPGRSGTLGGVARAFVDDGLQAVVLCASLLAMSGLLAALLVAWSRAAALRRSAVPGGSARMRYDPGVMARHGQALVLPAGFCLSLAAAVLFWPPVEVATARDGSLALALCVGLVFPSLVAERMLAAIPREQAREAPELRRALLVVTLLLGVAALSQAARLAGLPYVGQAQRAALLVSLLVGAEWALRGLGRLFLPTPSPAVATAATGSLVAALFGGGSWRPATLVRQHLGLDFSRSWALAFLAAASGWALVATMLLCWFLSGVKLLDDDRRGIYERFGAPVAVLHPGLHLLLPWPFGRLRPVEYGATHTIAVGAREGPDAYRKDAQAALIGADDMPTAGMNRLWNTAHATEADYLVGSRTGDQQGFQAVNGEILVIWRTGLSDRAALDAVYGAADQPGVVEQEADRLLTRFFSSHTLDQVLGGQRRGLQRQLRAALQTAVDGDHAGVDVVAVLVDAIHPPAGAAAAYHAVQAAEITADASVAQATAHATRTGGEASQEANQLRDAAAAGAVEKLDAAEADATRFAADRSADATQPAAFLLERRLRNLQAALPGKRLMVVDSALRGGAAPIIDMRANGTGGPGSAAPATGNASAAGDAAALPLPATSTEAPAPGADEGSTEFENRARGAGDRQNE